MLGDTKFQITLEPVDAETLAALDGLADIKDVRVVHDDTKPIRKIQKKYPRTAPGLEYKLGSVKNVPSGACLFAYQVIQKRQELDKKPMPRSAINALVVEAMEKDGRWAPSGISPIITKLIRCGALAEAV